MKKITFLAFYLTGKMSSLENNVTITAFFIVFYSSFNLALSL